MAGALKQSFIEAVRLTPDGIQDFLETPFPTVETIETPTTPDDGIIAAGVLSKVLLDWMKAFEGLTPIELLLRIGQHNTVLESAMIAGLEYLEGADSNEQDLVIVEPKTGSTYSPGEMRFLCTVRNGNAISVVVDLDGATAKMFSTEEGWQQYIDVLEGEHTCTMTANFEDGSTAEASVNFTVTAEGYEPPPGEEPPEPPGGKDIEAIKTARARAYAAYRQLIRDLRTDDERWNPYEEIAEFLSYVNQFKSAVNTFLGLVPDDTFTVPKKADITRFLSDLGVTGNTITERSSAIITLINTLYTYMI